MKSFSFSTFSKLAAVLACATTAAYADHLQMGMNQVLVESDKSYSYTDALQDYNCPVYVEYGASYTGTNITLEAFYTGTVETTARIHGMHGAYAKFISLTDSRISVSGAASPTLSYGFSAVRSSLNGGELTRTTIDNSLGGYGFYNNGGGRFTLSETHINVSGTPAGGERDYKQKVGMYVNSPGVVVKDGSTITVSGESYGSGVIAESSGTVVDISGTTISVENTGRGMDSNLNPQENHGVFVVLSGAALSVKDSKIVSTSGNTLFYNYRNGGSSATLDNVDLSEAKNQRIFSSQMQEHTITIKNGTHFDGFTETAPEAGVYFLPTLIFDSAQWTLTADSSLGSGKLLVQNTSATPAAVSSINFSLTGENDFYSIAAATISIESGSIININAAGYSGDDAVFQLFSASSLLDIADDIVINLSGEAGPYIWDTTRLSTDGTISVTRSAIPEPSTAVMVFFALSGALAARRKRQGE